MIINGHWVCFACRKQFRKPLQYKRSPDYSAVYPTLVWNRERQCLPRHCPECNAEMVNMGKYFKPPHRNDIQAWEQMQRLAEHSIRFTSEGTVAFLRFVGGPRPNKKAFEQMIACCPCHTRTEGQRLLLKIARKPHKQK